MMKQKSVPKSPHQAKRPKKVKFPLITSEGPKVNVTNKRIYKHVVFP
jgi:hypothetical protein